MPDAQDAPRPSLRLLEIERSTHERLGEARQMQWLGEVTALEKRLRHVTIKNQQAERLRAHVEDGDIDATALG